MRRQLITIVAATVAMLVVSVPVDAHHSNAAFDPGKETTLNGVVTDWAWINPHCLLQFDVTDAKGTAVTHWVVEASNPRDMTNRGWTKAMFKRGDRVTITVQPARNGTPVGRIARVVLPGGKPMVAFGAPAPAAR